MRSRSRDLMIAVVLLWATSAAARDYVSMVKENWHPPLPNPAKLTSVALPQLYVMGLPWCAATATMIATVALRRELKLSEAWAILGSCILPVLGGMAMKRLFAEHPEWDSLPLPPVWYKDLGIGSQS